MARRAAMAAAGLLLAVTGCSSPSGSAAVESSSPTASSAAASSTSSAAPTTAQWCASYAALTQVLSASATATGAAQGLLALDRFSQLWQVAGTMRLISLDEVAANQRAVEGYRGVLQLMANGSTSTSPAVVAARDALTKQTDSDHALLSASAGAVLGLCGKPSSSPSA